MPAPKPLTRCPPPDLDWSRPGTPAARNFDDIYFSVDGGLAESRAVFLEGCDLETRWAQNPEAIHVIGELGFGTGLNLMAVWDLWEQQTQPGHLHFISIEKFPFSQKELARIAKSWPDMAERYKRLLSVWPGPVKGIHRLELTPSLTLTLIHDDVEPALDGLVAQIDSWFLDGFSPAKNPDMWSGSVMAKLAALSSPGACLATFTVAGSVRTALTEAGFTVFKKDGFGRKRHRLEAVYDGVPLPAQARGPEPIRPVIIGGGVAGASVARAFQRAGVHPVLIEKEQDLRSAASGNPVAIVRPRLDLQDQPQNRFFLASYLYALNAYAQSPETIIAHGVKHLAKTAEEQARFNTLIQRSVLPPEHLAKNADGLYMEQALVIDPKAVIADWTFNTDLITATITDVERTESGWSCRNKAGDLIAHGTHVVLCSGAELGLITPPKLGGSWPEFRFSKGQLSWAQALRNNALEHTLTYGGYAVPMGTDILVGATHSRLGDENLNSTNPQADQHNLQKFFDATHMALSPTKRPSRASVRVTTPDTLPVLDKVGNRLWMLSGLGSRGFVFAPLLGAALVSQIINAPVPLEASVIQRFQIGNRFLPRRNRR